MMEDTKTFVRSTTEEIWRTGNANLIDEHMAPNYVLHKPPTGFSPDREGLKAILHAMRSAFPDLRMTVEDVIAEGEKVVQRRSYQGTHQGELFGIPASGKAISVSQITVSRVADGKFVEEWAETDFLGMLQQLGVVPTMG
ncbi:MAG TPA: ester cyclase [Ktedonobacterales bacterium]|nr:ester cyclase [Ktedonobacterales bacterium]